MALTLTAPTTPTTAYRRLVTEARTAAAAHGHTLRPLTRTVDDNGYEQGLAVCRDCGADVQVRTHPAANESDMGGSAVAQTCGTIATAAAFKTTPEGLAADLTALDTSLAEAADTAWQRIEANRALLAAPAAEADAPHAADCPGGCDYYPETNVNACLAAKPAPRRRVGLIGGRAGSALMLAAAAALLPEREEPVYEMRDRISADAPALPGFAQAYTPKRPASQPVHKSVGHSHLAAARKTQRRNKTAGRRRR